MGNPVAASSPGGQRPGELVIDAHCHAGAGDGLTGPWDTTARLGRYLRRATAAGISKTVLFAAFHSDYAVANEEVGRIVASAPGRLFGFAFVHARRDRGRVRMMVERAVYDLGFCGIKLHRHDAAITREVCETARSLSLPILYDVMGEVWVAELLAQEYPDVDFIFPHLGSFADDWRAQVAFTDHLVRHPNIYTDTSGVRRFDVLLDAVHRAGPSKVLFGSDGPWLHPGLELAQVRLLGLDRQAETLIVSGNFLRLVRYAGRPRVRPARFAAGRRRTLPPGRPLQPPSGADGGRLSAAPSDPWLSRPIPG
jgi:uncharacterized protein